MSGGSAAHRGRAVVIGAGIVGVACGLSLRRDGWSVTLIDRAGPGEGTSKGNAGLMALSHVTPMALPGIVRRVPGMLLDPDAPACHPLALPAAARAVADAFPARQPPG